MNMICPSMPILLQQSSLNFYILRVIKITELSFGAPSLCWRPGHMPLPSLLAATGFRDTQNIGLVKTINMP